MAVQVSELVAATILQTERIGKINISLSNYGSISESVVKQGSIVEVSGALFQSTSDDSISGLSGLSDGKVYIKGVVSGSNLAYSWTATAPTWFDTKQGYYDATGTDRYVGGGRKAGAYVWEKFIFYPIYNNLPSTFSRITGEGVFYSSGITTMGGSGVGTNITTGGYISATGNISGSGGTFTSTVQGKAYISTNLYTQTNSAGSLLWYDSLDKGLLGTNKYYKAQGLIGIGSNLDKSIIYIYTDGDLHIHIKYFELSTSFTRGEYEITSGTTTAYSMEILY